MKSLFIDVFSYTIQIESIVEQNFFSVFFFSISFTPIMFARDFLAIIVCFVCLCFFVCLYWINDLRMVAAAGSDHSDTLEPVAVAPMHPHMPYPPTSPTHRSAKF